MSRTLKVVVGIFAVIGLLVVSLVTLASLGLISSGVQECTAQIVMAVPSPDNRHIAQQEQTICKQGAEVTTNVWLLKTGGNRKSNAFEARSAQPVPNTNSFRPLELEIGWLSESELFISSPAGSRIWVPNSVEGIRIQQYERPPRPQGLS
jgi:hypothetical protein